jgi:hypothetical protein
MSVTKEGKKCTLIKYSYCFCFWMLETPRTEDSVVLVLAMLN